MTTTYLLSGLAAFLLSFGLTYFLNGWARRHKAFMTEVRPRDVHQKPTPRIGGIAIITAFLLVTLFWVVYDPAKLSFSDVRVLGIDRNLFGLLLAVLILTFVNVFDDWKAVDWRIKLSIQIAAAVLIALFGIRIQWFSNPFGGQLVLGALDVVFVIIWLVIISNTINWLDGIDGLAGGVGLISLGVLFFLSLSPIVHQDENALLSILGFGAILGFLPFNFFRKKAFLGDTGAVFIGFLVGVVAIISGGKVATAFLVLAIPFLDAVLVVFSRLFHHQSPFLADKRHLHHRLLAIGFKPWQILVTLYTLSLVFGLVALNTQTSGKLVAVIISLGIMGLLVLVYNYAPRVKGAIESTSNTGSNEKEDGRGRP